MMNELSELPMIDGDQLKAFVAFARERNFTRAAKQVALSQPAFFDRIRRLGDQLGCELYRRDGRELVLTPAGIRLAAFATDTLQRTWAFAAELKGETRDTVTLAAGAGTYLYVLGEALADFGRRKVGILHVRTLGGPSACQAVMTGEAHLAVGVFDLVPRGLESHDLFSTPLCAALSRRHPLAKKRELSLKDLSTERLILAPEGQKQRDLVGRAVASLGAPVMPPVEADGWALMLAFAAAELGIAVVNGICRPPPGVILRPVPELGRVTYRLLWRKSGARNAAIDWLDERIRKCRNNA